MKVLLYTEATVPSFVNKLIEEGLVTSENDYYNIKDDNNFRTNPKVIEIVESLEEEEVTCYRVEEIPDGSQFYITRNEWLIESLEIKQIRCFKKINHLGKVTELILSHKYLYELQEMQAKLTKESDVWKYTIQECSFQELKCGSENPYGVNMAVTLI